MTEDQIEKLTQYLKEIAKERKWSDADDFCPMDFSGGNFDDCYAGGKQDGRIALAREILEKVREE